MSSALKIEMTWQAIVSMKRTAAVYRGAGGQLIELTTFKIMAKLAYLFWKDVFVIGSHGFLSICNALGISSFFTGDDHKIISLAIQDERQAVSDISSEFDKHFFKGGKAFAINKCPRFYCGQRIELTCVF